MSKRNFNREELEYILIRFREVYESLIEETVDVTKNDLKKHISKYVDYLWPEIKPCNFETRLDEMLERCGLKKSND